MQTKCYQYLEEDKLIVDVSKLDSEGLTVILEIATTVRTFEEIRICNGNNMSPCEQTPMQRCAVTHRNRASGSYPSPLEIQQRLFKTLIVAVQANSKSLHTLELVGIQLPSFIPLFFALLECKSLKTLYLRHCNIGNHNCLVVAKENASVGGLCKKKSSTNRLCSGAEEGGGKSSRGSVPACVPVTCDFGSVRNQEQAYHTISYHPVEVLVQTLTAPHMHVQHLQLSHCGLQDTCADTIRRLMRNQANRRDGLSWEHLLRIEQSSKGGSKDADLQQQGLCSLDLSDNLLSAKMVRKIIQSCHNDEWLLSLDLRGNNVTAGVLKSLRNLYTHNNRLLVWVAHRGNKDLEDTEKRLLLELEIESKNQYERLLQSKKKRVSLAWVMPLVDLETGYFEHNLFHGVMREIRLKTEATLKKDWRVS